MCIAQLIAQPKWHNVAVFMTCLCWVYNANAVSNTKRAQYQMFLSHLFVDTNRFTANDKTTNPGTGGRYPAFAGRNWQFHIRTVTKIGP